MPQRTCGCAVGVRFALNEVVLRVGLTALGNQLEAWSYMSPTTAASSVPRNTSRLVDVENSSNGSTEDTKPGVDDVAAQSSQAAIVGVSGGLGRRTHGWHVRDEDDGREDGQHQRDENTVVPQEPPSSPQ